MIIHIEVFTMAAPREDPREDPRGNPRGDPPERPVPAPRAIQLTVKYPSFNSLRPLNKGQKYLSKAHMKITNSQTRLQQSLVG